MGVPHSDAMVLLRPNFGDAGGIQASIESSWRTTRSVLDIDVQTEPIPTSHQRTQEPRTQESEAQTTQTDEGPAAPLMSGGFGDASTHLNSFLLDSTPALEEQMLRNLSSGAFDGHTVSWEEEHDQVSCLHSLKHRGALASASPETCTAIAWNAGGTVLAAAYGPLDRNDWASCSSMLCTWSIFRRQLDPAKADLALELQDCLTCLAFHPEDPSLLAGGSFNGDVLLWNLAATDDKLLGKSTLSTYTHHEPVQRVCWTRDPQQRGHRGYLLCSIAADGKVLLWNPATKLGLPAMGYLLPMPSGKGKPAPLASATGGAGGQQEGMHAGGSALCFSRDDPNTFVVGLESGQLYKCSMTAHEARSADAVSKQRGEVPWTDAAALLVTGVPATHYHRLRQRVEKEAVLGRERAVSAQTVYSAQPAPSTLFQSPISFAYDKHSGPVYDVQFSPFHRNLFLSVATDSTARLYSVLQPRPVHVTEPSAASLFACAWSPARPLVFAVATADGNLVLFDLKRSRGKPDVVLQVTNNRSPVYACAFNPHQPNLLATADAQGFVKVWRLSTHLSTMAPNELQALEKLAATTVRTADTRAGEAGGGDEEDGGYGDDDFE